MHERLRTTMIVLHHSVTGPDTTVDAIRRWHMTPKPAGPGYADIGYHWLVYWDGTLVAGREETVVGSHALRYNAWSIGVCFVGDFTASPPSEAQWKAGLDLCRHLVAKYPQIQSVKGHRELATTECPGACFDIDRFRKELA